MCSKRIFIGITLILISCICATAQDASGVAQQIVKGRISTNCQHPGIRRVRTYDVSSVDIPHDFEGFRILFIADTHYPSLFTNKTLEGLGELIEEIAPDAMMLGGDYQEGCDYVEPLFATMMRRHPKFGTYAILGNNDKERCTDSIKSLMSVYGISFIEDTAVQISKGHSHITVAGAVNTFSSKEMTPSPTLHLSPKEFVILLTHTPDYAEDQDVTNSDLVLAGHTHGGQVTLFGAYAPVTSSHYGQRFLKGLNYNTAGQPVITTTGIGTSRRAVRFFAPSEVIIITLHSWSRGEKLPEPIVDTNSRPYLSKPMSHVEEPERQDALEMPKKL